MTATATSQGKNILTPGDKVGLSCLCQPRRPQSGHPQHNGKHINNFPDHPSSLLVKVYLLLMQFLASLFL
jgi:hypothetical protein